ncbi:hypothetical protein, partial [Sphingobacterium sp. SGL-16]|uniref:hypothetical protein n=1 Tax=Sphingobacterium sp. SGL-16 TaxID=2710883 RepID=UPI0019D0E696
MERSGVTRRGRPGCEKHTEKTLFFARETAFLIAGVQKNPYVIGNSEYTIFGNYECSKNGKNGAA